MSISDSDRRSCEGVQTGLDDQASPFRHAPREKGFGGRKRTFGAYLLSLPIWLYRWLISPWIGPRCRYLPTCSEYALDALMQHGAIKGGWLAICRIGRCHPLGGQGFDPVPGKKMSRCHPKTVEDGRSNNETHTETGLDRRLSF